MDFQDSTRTVSSTINPSPSSPPAKKYGDTLTDYFVNNQDALEGEYKDPATLAQYAYSQASDRDKMNFNDWSVHHGVDQFVANAPGALAKKQEADAFAASQPEDRGWLASTGTAIGRGVMDTVAQAGRSLSVADFTPTAIDTDKGILDRAGEAMTTWAEDTKANTQWMRPTKAEDAGAEGYIKRGVMGGVQSMPATGGIFAGGVAGAKAGAAIGTAFGPAGTATGTAIGGVVGALGTMGALFFGGQYDQSYGEVYKEVKEKRPGISEDEARSVAHKVGMIDGALETGTELISDVAASGFALLGGAAAKQPIKATLNEMFKPGVKAFVKNAVVHAAKQAPLEVGGEVATAAGEAYIRKLEGLSGSDVGQASIDAIIPALTMTVGLGAGIASYHRVAAGQIITDINSQDAQTRAKAAEKVAQGIVRNTEDEESAKAWYGQAIEKIKAGESIDVDMPVAEFVASKTRLDAAHEGKDVTPVDADGQPVAAETPAEHRQQSAAEQILTGGEDVTPEDVLLGRGQSSPEVGTDFAQNGGTDAQVQSAFADAEAARQDQRIAAEMEAGQSIRDNLNEISQLRSTKGKGAAERKARMQELAQENARTVATYPNLRTLLSDPTRDLTPTTAEAQAMAAPVRQEQEQEQQEQPVASPVSQTRGVERYAYDTAQSAPMPADLEGQIARAQSDRDVVAGQRMLTEESAAAQRIQAIPGEIRALESAKGPGVKARKAQAQALRKERAELQRRYPQWATLGEHQQPTQPEQKMYQNGGENVSLSPVHPIDSTEQRKQIAKLRTRKANLEERLGKENEKGRVKVEAQIESVDKQLRELLTNQQIPMEGDYGSAAETGIVAQGGSANAGQGVQGQVGVVPQIDNAGIPQAIQPGNTAADNGLEQRGVDAVITGAENVHHRLAAEGHIPQDVADQISAMPRDDVSEAEANLAYEAEQAAAMREARMATHDGLVGEIRRLGGIHPDQLDDATATALRDALGKDIVSKKGQPLDILSSVLTIDRTDIEGDSHELIRLLLDVSETKKTIDDDFKSKVDELKTAVLDARTRRDEQEAVHQGKVELSDVNPLVSRESTASPVVSRKPENTSDKQRTVKESSTVQPADQPRAETVTAPSTGEASKVSEPPTLPEDQRTSEKAGGVAAPGQRPSIDEQFDTMVKDAARWQGAARNLARELEGDNRASVRLSKITTKGDLDAYLMRKYGIDAAEARSVSNHLTARDIKPDFTATVEEFKDEPWVQEMRKEKLDDQAINILETYYQRVQDAGPMSPQPLDIRKVFAGSKYTVQQYKDGSFRIGHGSNQFTIRTVEQISPDRVAFEMKYGRKFDPAAESIAGRYLPSETTAEIVRGVGDKWTVWHETYHALEDIGVIKPFEQAVLNNAVDKADKAGTLRFDPMGDDGKRMKGDELRAYYVQHELAAREFDRKTTLGKVLQKIADFVDRIANLFTRTARGVVRDVESGRVMEGEGAGRWGKGQQYQSAATAGASPDEIADAAEKWRTMGVDSPYFKKWSGGAPFVEAGAKYNYQTGEPFVAEGFHGTPDSRDLKSENAKFKTEKERFGGYGRDSGVHWFTPSLATAKTYADPRRAFDYQAAEPGVVHAYVKMENPLVIDGRNMNWRDVQRRGATSDVIKDANSAGHDGVVITNVKDDYNNIRSTKSTTTYAVFESNQIKSVDNRGTFSPTDPRIQYQTMAKAGQQVRDFVSDATHSPEVFNRLFKNFQTQYHKALKHPVFKKFFDRIHEATGTQQRAAARASQLAKDILPAYDEGFTETMRQLVSRGKVKQSDLREVSRIMSRLTLMGEDSSPTSGHRLTDGPGGEIEALRRGETITVGEESFSMTPAQVDLYEQARNSLDQMLKDMATSQAWAESRGVLKDKGYWRALSDNPVNQQELLQSMLDDEMQEQQDALAQVQQDDNDEAQAKKVKKIERKLDAIEQAKKDVDRIFAESKKLIDAGYVPLSRFGKYRIDVHDPEGKLAYVGFYDTTREANRAKRELGRMFVDGETVGGVQTVSQDAWRLYQGQNPEALMLFAKKAGAESDAIQTYYKEALSSRSAMKRLIHRKGYAGYSDDLQRILASFITSGAKKVSSNYHAAALSDMLNVDSIPGDVKDEMIALQKYVQDPGGNGAAFRAFAANWYMLGSMATAAWNGTQVVTSTLPELYKYSGSVGGSTKELWKAYRTIAKKGADFTADERAAIKRAMEDGTIEAAEIHHLYQQATKRFINKLGQGEAARRAGSFLRLWGMPFAWFETMNRKASFIAAFRMGEDLKVKDPYAFAKQIVDVTQGIYQTHNRPNVARGAVGGAVMTFMQYKIQTLEQISRNMKEGGQARRAAMLQLAIIASLGGWKALPGAEDIADLFDAIMQIMGGKAWLTQREVRKAVEKGATEAAGLLLEKEAAAAVGKFSADFIHAGISAALPVDVSGRASMGQIVPGVKLLKPSTQYRDSEIFDMAGVPGSMVQSLLDASQMAMQGKMGQAAMRLAPNAVANAAKGVRIGLTGEIGNTAGRKITDGNMGDASMQFFGAQPRKKTEITGKLREGNELKYLVQQKEREFVEQWADSYSEKTPADRKAALDAVREAMFDWNRANPDWPIRITAQQVQRVLATRKRTTTELALKSAPREIRRTMGDL